MNENISIDTSKVDVLDSEALTLSFVDDADYEFVGGGNAVNGF